MLYGSQIAILGLGILTGVINTRSLGPVDYGILSFILVLISFVSLFFEFGFFSAGTRLLAIANDERKERECIGGLVLITVGIALLFSLATFLLSFFVDSMFHTHVGNILRIISILVCIFPFQYMIQQVCQGTNKIGRLSAYNVAPIIWYLIGALIVINLFQLTVYIALLLNLSGIILATIVVIVSLKPSFSDLRKNIGLLWKETKGYGFHVYTGRIASVSTYQLDKIFISYFVNTTWVGFYSLAMSMTAPMALLSRSLSITIFKNFAHMERIPKKVIYYNFLWLLCCVIGLVALGKYIIIFLFSDNFVSSVPLILPLALAGFFQGMYQPYNMFLGAHRKGEWMRNSAFMIAGMNLITNLILVPIWGAVGAAIASAISMGFALCLWIFYYRKYLKELEASIARR
ncbi:MAG: oligosaccharide flippase family protein [Desulfobacterales bacterium]|nr:oligosaccharide flippase family protein [Desulfobacterales bacterium]